MGLDDLIPEDSDDNDGGRPKEETDDRDVRGDPFYPALDSKEYWQDLWDEIVEGPEPTVWEIAEIADRTHLFPWDIRIYIEKWSIHEFDWNHMPDDYPPDTALKEFLEREGVENEFTKNVEKRKMGIDTSSGLGDLIHESKREGED